MPSPPFFPEPVARVKTKIIATVGPVSANAEMLHALVTAGVDIFRLNFAHGQHDFLASVVAMIRKVSAATGRPIGILADLAGPKIRLGEVPGDVLPCPLGARIEFGRSPDPAHPQRLVSTYEPLVDELRVGDRVLLADGAVTLNVVECNTAQGQVVCQVEQPGEIRSRQGINLPGVVLSTPSLTAKDREDLAFALQQELDFIGLSFVRTPDDIQELKEAIAALQPKVTPLIVAKIEKMEAVSQLDRILEITDAVMVARGDLGVEVDLAVVPGLQKHIIRACNERRIPVITATQMLDSMTHHNRPTRAEATDVANAVLDGSDAVMLSGETAVGEYPVEAVAAMSRIALEAERLMPPRRGDDVHALNRHRALPITEAVTLGAGTVAEKLEAEVLVVASRGGKTALAMSRQRNRVPILGVTPDPAICRRMCLYWGVAGMLLADDDLSAEKVLRFVIDWGRREKLLHPGSRLVLVVGSNWTGAHDVMYVHTVS